MSSAAKSAPMLGVLQALVENDFLVHVRIVVHGRTAMQVDDEDDDVLTLFLAPDTTVTELKFMIQQRLDMDPAEQCWSIVAENGATTPIFYGSIVHCLGNTDNPRQLVIHLQERPLDPRLVALYEITGYNDGIHAEANNDATAEAMPGWQERDKISQLMMQSRLAQQCWAGHELTDVSKYWKHLQEETKDASVTNTKCPPCVQCGFCYKATSSSSVSYGQGPLIRQVPMACAHGAHCREEQPPSQFAVVPCSTFVLCQPCYQRDQGRPSEIFGVGQQGNGGDQNPPQDLHQPVAQISNRIMQDLSRYACGFGGQGHLCGYRMIQLPHTHAEYSCHRLKQPDPRDAQQGRRSNCRRRGIPGLPTTAVFPAGICLTVRFDDDVRAVLQAAGKLPQLEQLEMTDQVLLDDDGKNPRHVYCRDIMNYRDSLERDKDLWPLIVTEWRNRFPFYSTYDGGPCTPYVTICFRGPVTMERAEMLVRVHMSDGDY